MEITALFEAELDDWFRPANTRHRDTEPDDQLKANPMALVLPAPATKKQVLIELSSAPAKRPEGFRKLTVTERKLFISTMHLFHYLFDASVDIVLTVLGVVRASYLHRTPTDPRIIQFIWSVARGERGRVLPRQSDTGGGGGIGMLLIGPSGMGKSSLLDRIVSFLGGGKAWCHKELAGRPCRWLQLGVVKVGVQKTWALTLQAIIVNVDSQLRSDYYNKRANGLTRGKLEQLVQTALTTHFCPLLILDEFQNLKRFGESEARQILMGLISLMETYGVPVLIAGTETVRSLLSMYPAELGKFCSGGTLEFRLFEEGSEDANVLLATYKSLHVSTTEPVYSDDFDFYFFNYTMRVPRVIREYMKVIFRRHADEESLVVDREMLKNISENEMAEYERAMSILRKRRNGVPVSAEDKALYEDLLPPDTGLLTPEQGAIVATWIREVGTQAQMTAEAYAVMRSEHQRVTQQQPESRPLLTPEAALLEALQSQFSDAKSAASKAGAPKSAKKGQAGREARTKKVNDRKMDAARKTVEALARDKVTSLDIARNAKSPQADPSVSVDEIR